ncbi:twin-arginine translocation signal domain-containing protein, partial [Paenibacillus hemerocallicola]
MNHEENRGKTEAADNVKKAAISRRNVLRTLGIGGAMLAGSAFASKLALADNASTSANGANRVLQVNNVEELKALPPGLLKDGQHVRVSGYKSAGDGGAKLVRWDSASAKTDNGGTVHSAGGASGRFEVVHNGIGDFR